MAAHVLSVGQCSADDWRMARVLKDAVEATMDRAYTSQDALEMLAQRPYDLVLVNRIIDGDGASGVDFIAEAKRDRSKTGFMLISDYQDAQARAVANGALPGFGKSALSEAAPLLRSALQPPHARDTTE